jgi:hypothetical protein
MAINEDTTINDLSRLLHLYMDQDFEEVWRLAERAVRSHASNFINWHALALVYNKWSGEEAFLPFNKYRNDHLDEGMKILHQLIGSVNPSYDGRREIRRTGDWIRET